MVQCACMHVCMYVKKGSMVSSHDIVHGCLCLVSETKRPTDRPMENSNNIKQGETKSGLCIYC